MLFQFIIQTIYKYIAYLVSLLLFSYWLFFSDYHSYPAHKRLDEDIKKIQKEIDFLTAETQKDLKSLSEINSAAGKEKYGREKYYLKRENEDIYIIQFDTI